jgi:hypothetical protein
MHNAHPAIATTMPVWIVLYYTNHQYQVFVFSLDGAVSYSNKKIARADQTKTNLKRP